MPKPKQTYMLTKGAGKISARAEDSKKLTSQAKKAQQKDELLAVLKRSRLTERDIGESIRFLESWGKGKEPTKTERDEVGKILKLYVELANNLASLTTVELVQDVRPVLRLPGIPKLQVGDAAGLLAAVIVVRAFALKLLKLLKALRH